MAKQEREREKCGILSKRKKGRKREEKWGLKEKHRHPEFLLSSVQLPHLSRRLARGLLWRCSLSRTIGWNRTGSQEISGFLQMKGGKIRLRCIGIFTAIAPFYQAVSHTTVCKWRRFTPPFRNGHTGMIIYFVPIPSLFAPKIKGGDMEGGWLHAPELEMN